MAFEVWKRVSQARRTWLELKFTCEAVGGLLVLPLLLPLPLLPLLLLLWPATTEAVEKRAARTKILVCILDIMGWVDVSFDV